MSARCVMVLGTSSGAGKSWLTTALCRHYADQGLKVAPFKAQNMSSNGRAIPLADGGWGEISAAQYFQALAARTPPNADMNPLLLKPTADTASQVVLLGRADAALSACDWHTRSERVWPRVAAALERLRAAHDVLVIEGAGSPAEINLMAHDIVNLRVARQADARCLLVADIDRGGAFAHLYGTWALLPPVDQARIAGFVLNKFRGDPALLAPAPRLLQERTRIPTLAVIPMLRDHGLPEEDGVFARAGDADPGGGARRVTIVAWPRVTSLDALEPLRHLPGVRPVWLHRAADLRPADWLLVPGSNAPAGDLAWARERGLERAIRAHAARGGRVLALGAGAALLGTELAGADGAATCSGLGVLPLRFTPGGARPRPPADHHLPPLHGAWQGLGGLTIHDAAACAALDAREAREAAAARSATTHATAATCWQNPAGNVLACALPHLLENPALQRALFGATAPTLDAAFDALAATVARCFAPGVLAGLIR